MEITNNYKVIDYQPPDADATGATGQHSPPSSPAYHQIQKKAAILLNNPEVPASQKSKIMALMNRGESAVTNGATGILRQLSVQLSKLDPESTSTLDVRHENSIKKQDPLNPEDEVQISHQDPSDDTDVLPKSSAAMNQDMEAVAVTEDEKKQANLDGTRTLIDTGNATTHVSRQPRYDSMGRLIIREGTITIIPNAKSEQNLANSEQSMIDTIV